MAWIDREGIRPSTPTMASACVRRITGSPCSNLGLLSRNRVLLLIVYGSHVYPAVHRIASERGAQVNVKSPHSGRFRCRAPITIFNNCGAVLNHENTKLFEKLSFFIMNETEPP